MLPSRPCCWGLGSSSSSRQGPSCMCSSKASRGPPAGGDMSACRWRDRPHQQHQQHRPSPGRLSRQKLPLLAVGRLGVCPRAVPGSCGLLGAQPSAAAHQVAPQVSLLVSPLVPQLVLLVPQRRRAAGDMSRQGQPAAASRRLLSWLLLMRIRRTCQWRQQPGSELACPAGQAVGLWAQPGRVAACLWLEAQAVPSQAAAAGAV